MRPLLLLVLFLPSVYATPFDPSLLEATWVNGLPEPESRLASHAQIDATLSAYTQAAQTNHDLLGMFGWSWLFDSPHMNLYITDGRYQDGFAWIYWQDQVNRNPEYEVLRSSIGYGTGDRPYGPPPFAGVWLSVDRSIEAPIPEPGTIVLSGIGCLTTIILARKRKP